LQFTEKLARYHPHTKSIRVIVILPARYRGRPGRVILDSLNRNAGRKVDTPSLSLRAAMPIAVRGIETYMENQHV